MAWTASANTTTWLPFLARRTIRRRTSVLNSTAIVVAGGLLVLAVIGPWITPYDPAATDVSHSMKAPSGAHWLGTDDLGRDVFSRVLAGTRYSLLAAVVIVVSFAVVGTVVATLATLGGRWVDQILMRACDIGLALPGMVMALGFAAALGPSLKSAIIALVIGAVPVTARVLRGVMRQTMAQPFIEGAQVLGVSRPRLMTRHVLPNSLDVVVVQWTVDIGHTVVVLSALSFIGVGALPPSPEWGASVAESQGYLADAWWVAGSFGLAITITAVAFGLVGDYLQTRRNPSLWAAAS
jgi:peptide/nickel transport system permease protein